MKSISKKVVLAFCSIASCCAAIFAMISGSSLEETVNSLMEDTINYANWYIAVIMFSLVILAIAVIALSFAFSKNEEINTKKTHLGVLILASVVTLALLIIVSYVISDYATYMSDTMLGGIEGSEATIKTAEETAQLMVNFLYKDTLLLVFFASIPNVVSILLICLEDEKGKNAMDDNGAQPAETENDDNAVLKSEITKLKKKLELEDLKEEYKQLYLQVKQSENKGGENKE